MQNVYMKSKTVKKRIITAVLCVCLLSGAALPAVLSAVMPALSLTALTKSMSAELPAMAADYVQNTEQVVVALGIITGDGSGSLKLTAKATRAEFAKMLVAASVYKDTVQNGSGSSPFKDVKYTHWASDYIKTVVDANWMTGYIDGTFQPNTGITFEQAASAVLRMLGYGPEDLTGTYPKAQISKFAALGLADGISPVQGRVLTRNECMYIFYNLMGAKTRNGEIYGTTLGYTIDSNGDIDYDALIKKNVTGPVVMSSKPLSSVVPFSLSGAAIFRNGMLTTADAINKYDVVYYNASAKLVLAYANYGLGTYTAATPNEASPTGVTVGGTGYNLGTSTLRNRLSSSGEFRIGDDIALLLGKDGDVVDVVAAHKVSKDYYSRPLVKTAAVSLTSLISADLSDTIVYRNNKSVSTGSISDYDVIYYNEYTNTLRVCSDRAIGTYTAVSPNSVSPASVTVAGNVYSLGTTTVKDKFSAAGGEFSVGDTVALLLGMNGDVVDVIDASKVDGSYYGVVTQSEVVTYSVSTSTSKTEHIITVMCTDGTQRQCVVSSDSYDVGNVVVISYSKGICTVSKPGVTTLSGTFSSDGKSFGGYKLAADVEIMDISGNGESAVIYPSRLSNVKLDAGKIRYYVLNNSKEMTHIILNDVTGDMHSYGVLTSVSEITTAPSGGSGIGSISGNYQYIINGTEGALNTTDKLYNISSGPTIFYYKSGKIDSMISLTGVVIDQLSALSVISGTQRLAIADNVQVYIRSSSISSRYSPSTLAAVNTEDYTLSGYYESIYPAGGQIRVIVAIKK